MGSDPSHEAGLQRLTCILLRGRGQTPFSLCLCASVLTTRFSLATFWRKNRLLNRLTGGSFVRWFGRFTFFQFFNFSPPEGPKRFRYLLDCQQSRPIQPTFSFRDRHDSDTDSSRVVV
jgi:hypothetical protein